jgi:YgiT-type zinc finger domain-containing protein
VEPPIASIQERKITYTRDLEGQIYLVTDVPAQVCPQCGEQYLSPDTVDVLQEVIERGAAGGQEPELPHFKAWREYLADKLRRLRERIRTRSEP